MRFLNTIISAITLVPLLCGCPNGPDRDRAVVFAVGGAPSEVRVWEQVAADFTGETGIAVRILRQPTDTSQRRQGLLVALNSRQSDPDVFLMDIAWLGLFARSGWLWPLSPVDPAPFFPQILQQADMFNDELVALPIFLDVGVLYYRTDLLQQDPPRTWSQLAAAAGRIQERARRHNPDFYGFVWPGAQYEGLVVAFLDFAGSNGGFIVDNGRVIVDTPVNIKALSMMVDFIHTLHISPPNTFTEMQEEEVRLYFQTGNALFERNWPYAYALHQSQGSPVQGKTAVAALPAPEGGQSAPTLGGWHVGVSAYSDVKQRARQFALYLTSRAVLKKLVLALGIPPGRPDLYADAQVLEKYPHYAKLASIVKTARPRPIIPDYTLVSAIMQRRLSGALARNYKAAKALALAQEEIDALMARTGGRKERRAP
jgi:multiple sugar transport system substrate-binding protein